MKKVEETKKKNNINFYKFKLIISYVIIILCIVLGFILVYQEKEIEGYVMILTPITSLASVMLYNKKLKK